MMRSDALNIMRKALEIERLVTERKSEIPADFYRELYLAASRIKFDALLLLKDIDERLFNIAYAIYDVV